MTGQKKQVGTDGILRDGKNDWAAHKVRTVGVAEMYQNVDPKKSVRMSVCGDLLGFLEDEGKKKLVKANLCKLRLCPMCQWRRTKKVFAQMSQIINYINVHKKCRYIFVTLTIRNCEGDELGAKLDAISKGWKRLQKYPEFNMKRKGSLIQGWYRSMEVTHNVEPGNLWFDTYHPHIHAIFAVSPHYFNRKNPYYCTFKRLQEIWAQAMELDYLPDVSINAISEQKPEAVTKAIAEIGKYSVKSNDYVIPDHWDFSVNTLKTLDRELRGRRFISFGGIFRTVHKLLHLDDMEMGDLVELAEQEVKTENDNIVWYAWNAGYRQYMRS